MKKLIFVSILVFILCNVAYSHDMEESQEKISECFIYPTLGWGAVGINTGFDFIYRHKSGFALFCNSNISFPLNKLGGIIAHQELYFGYALKYNNLYVALAGGIWGGAGVTFYKLEGNSNLEKGINFLVLFGIRNDYMYFFNQKVGFSFSHTYGFGVHYGRWVLDDRIRYYSFLIKTAVAFRI